MSFGSAARTEEHSKLRVPANLPSSQASEVSTTDYADVKAEPGVAGEVELVRERYPDGKVRVERNNGGGRAVLVSLGPGAIFGEMAFIEDALASASVV